MLVQISIFFLTLVDLQEIQKFPLFSSSHLEHTCRDEFLDLGHDDWVFKGGLASNRVLLHVAKDLHDTGIAHNVLDFWICHGVLHSFLVVSAGSVRA